MIFQGEPLGDKVEVDEIEGTSWEEIGGCGEIAYISGTMNEGRCGESMGRNMGKSGGEDSGLCRGEWLGYRMLIGMV